MNDMEYWREEQFADYKSRCVGMQNIRGMAATAFTWVEGAELSKSLWTCPMTKHSCVANMAAVEASKSQLQALNNVNQLTEVMNTLNDFNQMYSQFEKMGQFSVDPSCLRDVVNDVVAFQQEFDSSATCWDQTMSLEENAELRKAFDAIELASSNRDVSGITNEFVQYLDTSPSSYKSVCESNGGTHVEFNLEATCRGWKIMSPSLIVEEYEVDVVVENRPRCYGVACSPKNDYDTLLEDFTLRETERRWESEMPNTFSVCRGQVQQGTRGGPQDQQDVGVCTEETAAIGEAPLVKSTNNAIIPDVKQKESKILFFSVAIKDEYDSTFENSNLETAAYESKCVDNGGNYSIADDFVLQCEGGAQKTLKFHVSGFPVCLSSFCTTDSNGRGAAEAVLMKEKLNLVESALSGSGNYKCSHTSSGALSLLSTQAMLSLVILMGGSMWFL